MRSGVTVTFSDDQSEATLEYEATNAVTAVFFSAFLGLLALLPFALSIAAVANGRVDLAAVFFAVSVGAVWAIRRFVWRPKTYQIHFGKTGITTGGQHFAYDDIASHGTSASGGDAYDPASMPVPRNVTTGPHVFLVLKSDQRQRPITVNMSAHQARDICAELDRLIAHFAR